MIRPLAVAVLAAFAATTAVPGPSVVSHHHAGGDHQHVHAGLVHDEDDHDEHGHHHHAHDQGHHREHEIAHALRHRGHAHRPRVTHETHDPLQHTHVVSPFQPATRPAAPSLRATVRVHTERLSAPIVSLAQSFRAIRSRGPPPPARV